MGLLDFLKKEPRIEIPAGPKVAGIYVYDDRKLPRKPQYLDTLVVDYVPGKQKMVSSSGNESITEGALSYKGRIFGCTFHPDAVKNLKKAAKFGKVSCTMICTDTDLHGYPHWSLAFPERKGMTAFLKSLEQ